MPMVLASKCIGMGNDDLFNIVILPFIFLSGFGVLLVFSVSQKYANNHYTPGGLVLTSIFLFSGLLFYSVVEEGKLEGVVAFFILLGVFFLPERKVLSGICFGLALCTKQIAVLCVIPTFFVLVREGSYRNLLKWLSGLTVVVAIVLIPFIWGSGPKDMYIAMFKNFELHKIQKDTPFGYLYMLIKLLLGDESGSIERFMQLSANNVVLSACVLISLLLVLKRNIDLSAPERYFALLVVCSFLFITFGKWYAPGTYEVMPLYIFLLWAVTADETTSCGILLLLQAFIVCSWPATLYKKELLILLYVVISIYVYHKTFRAKGHEPLISRKQYLKPAS